MLKTKIVGNITQRKKEITYNLISQRKSTLNLGFHSFQYLCLNYFLLEVSINYVLFCSFFQIKEILPSQHPSTYLMA